MSKTFLSLLTIILSTASVVAQKPRLVTPIGHTGLCNSVAYSPNGKYVLTGSIDFSAKLWDMKGKELLNFNTKEWVYSAVFSPRCEDDPEGGRYVLLGSGDNTVTLWNLKGEKVQTFSGHNSQINSVAFSPDGRFIISGGRDGYAQLWDLNGNQIRRFPVSALDIESVGFSPDGKTIFTTDDDGILQLWDLDGNPTLRITYNASNTFPAVFSPDGKTILTGHFDQTATLWDSSGNIVKKFVGHKGLIPSVAFSPDGKFVLTGSFDKTAKLWDLDGNVIRTFDGNKDVIWSVAFSPDGESILTSSDDKRITMWDLAGNKIQSFNAHANSINFVDFDPADKKALGVVNYILTGGYDGNVCRWNIADRSIKTFKTARHDDFAPLASDGKSVLTLGKDNSARRWDFTGKEMQSFVGHEWAVVELAFSPDGKSVLTGSQDRSAKLWDLNGNCTQTFSGHKEGIEDIAFSPACPDDPIGGKYVLTGTRDNTAILWNMQGEKVKIFDCKEWVGHVAFSPDGKSILTVSDGILITLWDFAGNVLQQFSTVDSIYAMSVAFSPPCPDDPLGGKYILIGDYDGTATLYDLSGHVIREFRGSTTLRNRSVAFSPDGKFILTGADDNVTKLWDAASGNELASLVSINSGDWVVTHPSGLFDASPGAMQLMHYMVGLEVIELEQLKERYYEPGLLQKLLGNSSSELRSVAALNSVALYPEIKARIENNLLQISLTERNGGMGKLSLFVNGKIKPDINPDRLKTLTIDLTAFANLLRSDTTNTIALVSYDSKNWLRSQAYELPYRPSGAKGENTGSGEEASDCGSVPPHLYLIVVGTSKYSDASKNLTFPDLDASEMAKALSSTGNLLFSEKNVHLKLLSTAGGEVPVSSKANIEAAFGEFAKKATPCDVLVAYFSGHGATWGKDADKTNFYYLTKDITSAKLSDELVRKASAVSDEDLTAWLAAIPAQKQVLILDACNSGKAAETLSGVGQRDLNSSQVIAFELLKDRTGTFILTGSTADMVSFEASKFGQGLLTYSLLEGMSGTALKDGKFVDIITLFQHSRTSVPLLAASIMEIQTPVIASPNGASSFPIGIKDASVKIEVAQPKPVVIHSNFQDKDNFDDGLGLTEALNEYFQDQNADGAQARFVYYDISKFADGYSIKGNYSVSGETVSVAGRLFKGNAPVGEAFKLKGGKDPAELAKMILKIVDPKITVK